jgi:hypothetical protein
MADLGGVFQEKGGEGRWGGWMRWMREMREMMCGVADEVDEGGDVWCGADETRWCDEVVSGG